MPNKDASEIPMVGGKVSSSKADPIHLIPTEAIQRYARRCAVGVVRKGNACWNATTDNQDALTSVEFLYERITHVVEHALKLRDKLARGENLIGEDDDAGAVIWGGGYLCCATRAIEDERKKAPKAAPPDDPTVFSKDIVLVEYLDVLIELVCPACKTETAFPKDSREDFLNGKPMFCKDCGKRFAR